MKIRKLILELIIGAIVTAIVLYKVGPDNILNVLKLMNFAYFPIIFVLMMIATLVYPLSLVMLYRPIVANSVPITEFFKQRLLSQIAGNITPNKIGELYLFFVLKNKQNVSVAKIFYIFLLDKIVSLLHALIFSAIGFFFLFSNTRAVVIFVVATAILLIGLILLVIFLKKLENLARRLLRIVGINNIIQNIGEFARNYIIFNFKYIVLNLVLTFISFLLTASVAKTVFAAFDVHLPFVTYFLIINMVSIMSLIPLNVIGFGVKEVSSIFLFTSIGVSADIATSTTIVLLIIKYMVFITLYLFFKRYNGKLATTVQANNLREK